MTVIESRFSHLRSAAVWRVAQIALRLRNRHFLLLDVLILAVTPALALILRVDANAIGGLLAPVVVYTAYALVVRLIIFYAFDFYRRYWRYASLDEVVQLSAGNLVSLLIILLLFFGVRLPALGLCQTQPALCALPRSLPAIDGLLVMIAVAGSRFSVRLAMYWLQSLRGSGPMRRVLVMGAGAAGAMIVRELRANPQLGLDPIGFVDDDIHKLAVRIHGLPVLGGREEIPDLVREGRIQQVIIAMPSAPGKVLRDVVNICDRAGVPTKIIPGMYELLDGAVSVSQLRDVEIADLLRREPVKTDTRSVKQLLRGKRVLVTGGGGSIGSELCRQIWRCAPAQLVILGHGENSVFDIYQELARHAPVGNGPDTRPASSLNAVIADIRLAQRLEIIFRQYRPQVVFHAAAHKHVPLMERNPAEAITNNVLGTQYLLQTSLQGGVEHFVMISTDKAVNPTSIMGASKRAAELLVQQAARQSGSHFVAVRFGNVLGSRGSVIHTFKQQIAVGGPVTVTHPEMTRYFMTIPEAVQLVLQASVLGEGSETFVLDMGDPVKIVDLARDLIELSGLEVGRDIDIVFSGMRPGEKLFEELFVEGEQYRRTRHEKIFIADSNGSFTPRDLDNLVSALGAAAEANDKGAILQGLEALIPEFRPAGDSVVGVGREDPSSSLPLESSTLSSQSLLHR